MCTTIGFAYEEGQIFGRTLELGMMLDNKILYLPKGPIKSRRWSKNTARNMLR